MKIVISKLPPNINKYIGRTNIWQYQKDKKAFHELVEFETLGNDPNYKYCDIDIKYHFKDRRKRDTHNLTKCLMDALVTSNIIEDDNYFVLKNFNQSGIYDKGNSFVEIEISEAKNGI